jgi:hypothetical protein
MEWNASQYNITELSVSSNQLWTPDVVVVNTADGKYSRNREHYALLLRNDGRFSGGFSFSRNKPIAFLCT